MKIKQLLVGAIGVSMLAGTAAAGTISALGSDGQVYNVDVISGVATGVSTVPDPAAGDDSLSPNALGVNGAVITTMTFNTAGDEEIFVDGVQVNSFATGPGSSVAAGDSFDGTYFYVERDFSVYSVGLNGAGARTMLGDLGDGETLGDVAVMGTTGYLTFGNSFGIFDLTSPITGFSQVFSPQQRFVGLGFDGSVLYGINKDAELFQWNGMTDATFSFTKVADITGLNADTQLTDASRAVVPLPAAGWMLIAGLGGLLAMRRRQRA